MLSGNKNLARSEGLLGADAPLARILVTPSAMSESDGGTVDVAEVFPDFTMQAGTHLLTLDNFAPGLTLHQRIENLSVTDDAGPVALTPNKAEYPDSWDAGRDVHGTLKIHYRLPIVNDTHATGGPQGSPRITIYPMTSRDATLTSGSMREISGQFVELQSCRSLMSTAG